MNYMLGLSFISGIIIFELVISILQRYLTEEKVNYLDDNLLDKYNFGIIDIFDKINDICYLSIIICSFWNINALLISIIIKNLINEVYEDIFNIWRD